MRVRYKKESEGTVQENINPRKLLHKPLGVFGWLHLILSTFLRLCLPFFRTFEALWKQTRPIQIGWKDRCLTRAHRMMDIYLELRTCTSTISSFYFFIESQTDIGRLCSMAHTSFLQTRFLNRRPSGLPFLIKRARLRSFDRWRDTPLMAYSI